MASNKKSGNPNNINIKNRRATFDYEILETFTAGIVLTGTEIKSIRQGKHKTSNCISPIMSPMLLISRR